MTTGFLAHEEWSIPAYAQQMLWLRQGDAAVQVSGPRGLFKFDPPSSGGLRLMWGTTEGTPLAAWPETSNSESITLNWNGHVAVGGFITRLHALEVRDLEIVIAEVEGGLLPPGYVRWPSLAEMSSAPFRRDLDQTPVERDYTYTFLVMADSIYAEYLHHALVSELAVDLYAGLGPQKGRWADVVGLPLLIESVSLVTG